MPCCVSEHRSWPERGEIMGTGHLGVRATTLASIPVAPFGEASLLFAARIGRSFHLLPFRPVVLGSYVDGGVAWIDAARSDWTFAPIVGAGTTLDIAPTGRRFRSRSNSCFGRFRANRSRTAVSRRECEGCGSRRVHGHGAPPARNPHAERVSAYIVDGAWIPAGPASCTRSDFAPASSCSA